MKKLFALTLVVVLTFGFTTVIFAQNPWGPRNEWCFANEWCGGFGLGWRDGFANCPFRDASGNFLQRADIVDNLDALVADGSITAAQRDLWLERYDQGFGLGWCGGGRFGAGGNRQQGGGWQGGGRGWRWQ